MSIPFYFAAEENETAPTSDMLYAQLGYGFNADGTLRLPTRLIPDAPPVIDDLHLPAAAPPPAVLDRLAEACGNGCFLDFEQPINEVSAAIAIGLQQRIRAKITVPPALHRLCPDADVQVSGLLCNCWESFTRKAQALYGNQWVLEIIPWNVSTQINRNGTAKGYLKTAQCSYRSENGATKYYDTEASVKRKIAVAEKYGCRAAIALLREYKQCAD